MRPLLFLKSAVSEKRNFVENSLQNEPFMSKQKLKIVKISHIIYMGFYGHCLKCKPYLYIR